MDIENATEGQPMYASIPADPDGEIYAEPNVQTSGPKGNGEVEGGMVWYGIFFDIPDKATPRFG